MQKDKYWIAVVQRWQASGLNQAEFCRRSNVDVTLFYNWRQKLEQRHLVESATEHPADGLPKQHQFVPVHISEEQGISTKDTTSLEVFTPSGYVVRIS